MEGSGESLQRVSESRLCQAILSPQASVHVPHSLEVVHRVLDLTRGGGGGGGAPSELQPGTTE